MNNRDSSKKCVAKGIKMNKKVIIALISLSGYVHAGYFQYPHLSAQESPRYTQDLKYSNTIQPSNGIDKFEYTKQPSRWSQFKGKVYNKISDMSKSVKTSLEAGQAECQKAQEVIRDYAFETGASYEQPIQLRDKVRSYLAKKADRLGQWAERRQENVQQLSNRAKQWVANRRSDSRKVADYFRPWADETSQWAQDKKENMRNWWLGERPDSANPSEYLQDNMPKKPQVISLKYDNSPEFTYEVPQSLADLSQDELEHRAEKAYLEIISILDALEEKKAAERNR